MPFIGIPTAKLGKTAEVEKWMYSYYAGMSFEAVAYVHGHSTMYWYRAFTNLGRYSLVGTTIKEPQNLPKNILADEKHTRWYGKRVYLATTVAEGCILGAALSETANEKDLTFAYAEFMFESQEIDPNYQPISVNTDGWSATQKSWKNLADKTTLILCFLHAAMKIRDRSRREKLKETVMSKVWECYHALNKASFSQQIRRLREWTEEAALIDSVKEQRALGSKVFSLCEHANEFKIAFELPGIHRTSNMLDRLMNWQDRMLYKMKYLHDSWAQNARLFIRAMALIWNFHPYTKRTGRHSPFEDVNGFIYHENWLQNLLIAGSLGGFGYVTNPIR